MIRYLFFVSHLYAFAIVRPLQKAIRQRGDDAAWFLNHKQHAGYLHKNEKHLKTIEEVMAYNPSAVFVASNIVPDFFPGLKVQLFHGFNAQKREENRGHFRIRGLFDLYCTQGPSTTLPFKRLAQQHGNFEVVETGWPKMDPLFDKSISVEKRKKPVILFTSTFTPSLSAAHRISDEVERLSYQDRWEWIVTFHPKMDRAVVKRFKAMQHDNLRFVDTDNVLPLLKQADVMLSDSSSIISEFLLQGRPVVTYQNRVPGPHLINVTEKNQIGPALAKALAPSSDLLKAIETYVERIHPYYDGMSSNRVLEATTTLAQKGLDHLRKKPLNLLRKAKIRKRLHYYKL